MNGAAVTSHFVLRKVRFSHVGKHQKVLLSYVLESFATINNSAYTLEKYIYMMKWPVCISPVFKTKLTHTAVITRYLDVRQANQV